MGLPLLNLPVLSDEERRRRALREGSPFPLPSLPPPELPEAPRVAAQAPPPPPLPARIPYLPEPPARTAPAPRTTVRDAYFAIAQQVPQFKRPGLGTILTSGALGAAGGYMATSPHPGSREVGRRTLETASRLPSLGRERQMQEYGLKLQGLGTAAQQEHQANQEAMAQYRMDQTLDDMDALRRQRLAAAAKAEADAQTRKDAEGRQWVSVADLPEEDRPLFGNAERVSIDQYRQVIRNKGFEEMNRSRAESAAEVERLRGDNRKLTEEIRAATERYKADRRPAPRAREASPTQQRATAAKQIASGILAQSGNDPDKALAWLKDNASHPDLKDISADVMKEVQGLARGSGAAKPKSKALDLEGIYKRSQPGASSSAPAAPAAGPVRWTRDANGNPVPVR